MPATNFGGHSRFTVLEPLGTGSMCVVYRARDNAHGDVVALKTLRHLDPNSLYRLKQEFRALSGLDHPNLVSFYELVQTSEGWFVTMELVEGEDFLSATRGAADGARSRALARSTGTAGRSVSGDATASRSLDGNLLEGRPYTPTRPRSDGRLPDLVRLRSALRQLVEGVAALHRVGRIHRDLKPSNVMVSRAGRVVVLDFGLVAEVDHDYTEGTLHQNIAGSAAYMSPEQAAGEPLTEASDLYAVGVMLFEALTGAWPFVGSLYDIIRDKREFDAPDPSSLVQGIPADLQSLCQALLQRRPQDRPTAAAVSELLRGRSTPAASLRRGGAGFRFREAPMMELVRAYQSCSWGQPAMVTLYGAPGLGKSELLREFVKLLKRRPQPRRPALVLKGRCYRWEEVRYEALDGVMDNLARALRRLDAYGQVDLTHDELDALGAVFPVLLRVEGMPVATAEVAALPHELLRQRAFQGLRKLFNSITQAGPVVLIIDDAHWGDLDSADFLAELLRVERKLPLLLVVTARPDETSVFLNRFVPPPPGLEVRRVDLAPFSDEQAAQFAAELLRRGLGDPEVLRVSVDGGGNPRLLRELAARSDLQQARRRREGDEVDEITAAALGQLTPEASRLLNLLAVAGQPMSTGFAIELSQVGSQAFQAMSLLRAHDVLALTDGADGEALEIPSDRLRQHLYDQLEESARERLHLRLARALELIDPFSPDVLRHYDAAGALDDLNRVAWSNLEEARRQGALSVVADLCDRLLELPQLDEGRFRRILTWRAEALAGLGRAVPASVAFERAAQQEPPPAQWTLRRRALIHAWLSGQMARGDGMLTSLRKDTGVERRFWNVGSRLRRWQLRLRGAEFEPRSPDLLPQADREGLLVLVSQCEVGCWVDPSRSRQEELLLAALDAGWEEVVHRAWLQEMVLRAREAPSGKAWLALQEVLSELYPRWTEALQGEYHLALAQCLQLSGTWERVGQEAEDAVARLSGPRAWTLPLAQALHMRALLALGVVEAAQPLAEGLRRVWQGGDAPVVQALAVAHGEVPLRLIENRPDEAIHLLPELAEWSVPAVWVWTARLLALLYQGEIAQAVDRWAQESPAMVLPALRQEPDAWAQVQLVRGLVAAAGLRTWPAQIHELQAAMKELRVCVLPRAKAWVPVLEANTLQGPRRWALLRRGAELLLSNQEYLWSGVVSAAAAREHPGGQGPEGTEGERLKLRAPDRWMALVAPWQGAPRP